MPSSAVCFASMPHFCLARTAAAVSGHATRSIPMIFQTLARLHPAVPGVQMDYQPTVLSVIFFCISDFSLD